MYSFCVATLAVLLTYVYGNADHADDLPHYKVSHKPGHVKIRANPEGAEYDYSGGDLDVNIRPSPNEVTSIMNFYGTNKRLKEGGRFFHPHGEALLDDDGGLDEKESSGHFYESEDNHPFKSHTAVNTDRDTLSSDGMPEDIPYSGDNNLEGFKDFEHSGDNHGYERTGSFRNEILQRASKKDSHQSANNNKAKNASKKQLWRKPFDFHGSILARFKQHWAEEEKENKDTTNEDYEADRKFEEERRRRHRHNHNPDNEGRPTSEELMRNVNTPKQIYPSDDAIHSSGDGAYKPNPKQHDEATSRHEFTSQDENKKKQAEEEKKKKKKKQKEAKKASKSSAADKAYSSIKALDDDDEGPDDPPDSRTKTAARATFPSNLMRRGELHWDEDMPKNVSSSTEDESPIRSTNNKEPAAAAVTTTPKPSEDAIIQVPQTTPTTANLSDGANKKDADRSIEDAYSSIKEKEPASNLLPPDASQSPYGMAKPNEPIVSPPTPMSDLPPQLNESPAEKESRSDKMNLGQINSDAELPDELEHETGKGFRPPSNWYNKMPKHDRMNHEFHEQLMDQSIIHGPKQYKDIEPPHEGVEKFGNANEEIDINDRTREGDVDEEEVENRMQSDKTDLPTHDGDEMSKLDDLDNSYTRKHHHRPHPSKVDQEYHQRDEDYPRDDKYDREEREREYEREHARRTEYTPRRKEDAYENDDRDRDGRDEENDSDKERYANHHNAPEYDDDEDDRHSYDRESDSEREPYESDRDSDRNNAYNREHNRPRDEEMEMDEYSDNPRPKHTPRYTPKHDDTTDTRYAHAFPNTPKSKPLSKHFNFETGEVDDPAAAAEAVASVIENKPNSPYSMFREKLDESGAGKGDVMKQREKTEQSTPNSPVSRPNPNNAFLQNQYQQMFNKMDTKSSYSVSQPANNPLLSAQEQLGNLDPKQFTPKAQPSLPSEKVEPEVKPSNIDGLFKEKIDPAPQIKDAEQAENLIDQMQEIAMKNQKLLDSPEAITSRNSMSDLASSDMPPLNFPPQGSTPLAGGKKHTIQHSARENFVSKKRRKRHKSTLERTKFTKNGFKNNSRTLNNKTMYQGIAYSNFDELLDRITNKLETTLNSKSQNKSIHPVKKSSYRNIQNSNDIQKDKTNPVNGVRKNTAAVNSSVTINMNGFNPKSKNNCKKCILQKIGKQSIKTKQKEKDFNGQINRNSGKTNFHSIPIRKDTASVNSSVSINITGLNNPNVNCQNFLTNGRKQKGKKKISENHKLFKEDIDGKPGTHLLPIRKDTASVNSSVSINITGLNNPNVNCQNFLPGTRNVNKQKMLREYQKIKPIKSDNKTFRKQKNHKTFGKMKINEREKLIGKNKTVANFHRHKFNKADRRDIIKDPDAITIAKFYNPQSRTLSSSQKTTTSKTSNRRKQLILSSFFSKSQEGLTVTRMRQGGRALASRNSQKTNFQRSS